MSPKIRLAFSISILALPALLAGCDGDDDPLAPAGSEPGTILIDSSPEVLDAPWMLSGLGTWTGFGDSTLTGMAAGEYTLTWGTLSGWNRPDSAPATLAAGGTISFSGEYDGGGGPAGEYVLVPPLSEPMPQTFNMGSLVNPVVEDPHNVTLTRRFQMAATEVTNRQYLESLQWAYNQGHVTADSTAVNDALDDSARRLLVLGNPNSSIHFSEGVFYSFYPARPVVHVSWYGAAAYCDWQNWRGGLPLSYDHGSWACNGGDPYGAAGYRLPTEAEWEFACRAGTTTHFNTGDCLEAGTEANYNGDYPMYDCPPGAYLGSAAEVGSYPANSWGLHDVHGNVWEWCNDWYNIYVGEPTDPPGFSSGTFRVLRGGRWAADAYYCRSAYRGAYDPGVTTQGGGFRPVKPGP